MATNTRGRRRRATPPAASVRRQLLADYFPAWILLAVVLVILIPDFLAWGTDAALDGMSAAPGAMVDFGGDVLGAAVDAGSKVVSAIGNGIKGVFKSHHSGTVAPLFTEEVRHWEDSLKQWAEEYDLDPNLLATVMQIESCGHPTIASEAGAQGLFQVMPYHFASEEDQLHPDTNAQRGAQVLTSCLSRASGNTGLALACYNGGPSVITSHFNSWPAEVQRYYFWATGIYADAQNNRDTSDTLNTWLEAGGVNLCNLAADAQKER